MIGKLTGRFAGTTREGAVLVDVGGVGYLVRVPATLIPGLVPRQPIELFVHTVVRDDAIDLYGFPAENELAFFKLLTSVSGVGPKTALSLLNVADVRSLSRTIAAGDAGSLTKLYGAGKKMAERVVLELRDKLGPMEADRGDNLEVQAMEALQALGYSASEAREALRKSEGRTVNERVAAALRQLGTGVK